MADSQGKILLALSRGAVISVEYVNSPPSSSRKVYRLSTTNKAIRPERIEQLLRDRLIRPNEDGLPGIGETQTYSLWRTSDGGA